MKKKKKIWLLFFFFFFHLNRILERSFSSTHGVPMVFPRTYEVLPIFHSHCFFNIYVLHWHDTKRAGKSYISTTWASQSVSNHPVGLCPHHPRTSVTQFVSISSHQPMTMNTHFADILVHVFHFFKPCFLDHLGRVWKLVKESWWASFSILYQYEKRRMKNS